VPLELEEGSMAIIRHLRVWNFRGIQELDWHVNGRVICLVGAGDSAKTTVLNAIELAILPRWNTSFTDSDFYQADIAKEIVIEATVGELPEELIKEDRYGLYLRGYSAQEFAIHDDPADDDEDVLTIRLTVGSDLEPQWTAIKDSNPEPRPIPWRHREMLGTAALGDDVERNLTWSRGSALARLTDSKSSSQVIAVANRKAREAVGEMDLEEWRQIAEQAEVKAKSYGVPVKDLKPGLDVGAIRFGQGVLSLYDGPIPLRSFGLGSRRLAALAVQEAGIGKSSIVLVDEVEHGLEPHRIRNLLKILCEDRNEGQIIMTSHSPTPVVARPVEELRFTQLVNGRLDVLGCDAEARPRLQSVLRKCPLAVFARSIIVCEGKTEEALCNALNPVWAASHGGKGFELLGVVAVSGEGGAAPEAARQLAKLGYRTALFGDSDKPISPPEEAVRAAGAEVLLWGGKMATEQRIAADVPIAALQALLKLAGEIRSEQSCTDSCKTQLAALGANQAAVTGIVIADWQRNGIDESTLRAAIGKAAKASGWFKNLNDGERLAELVVAALPDLENTRLRSTLRALEKWVYGG
jgi:putative AbiEii toxin of type IV toxin-antitoxin system